MLEKQPKPSPGSRHQPPSSARSTPARLSPAQMTAAYLAAVRQTSAHLSAERYGAEPPPEAQGVASVGPGPEARRHSILIVDDDDAIREALEDVLSDEGYHVVGMSDGQQALTYLQAEPRPSAMLVDLWMPVMDGWKFLDAVLDDPRLSRIPLIVLTAARDQRARDLRVSEVLTKPVQLQQVLAALERLTKVSRLGDVP
jgi:CheY-like chemotaxis protein